MRDAPGASDWLSPIGRDHALAGHIYDVRKRQIVARADLVRAAGRADFVLLGEQHDNADHHRLQAELLEAIVDRGRDPAIAFEQLDVEDQAAVDASLAGDSRRSAAERADSIAAAVEWERSGWPPFAVYRPIFQIALEHGLPIRAANLSRARLHEMFAKPETLDPADPSIATMSHAVRDAMAREVEESHCGHAPAKLVALMIEAQRRRDAQMAGVLVEAADLGRRQRGAVLVCGFAHARKDAGVPLTLRRDVPDARIVSVAFIEVAAGADQPADYEEAFHTAEIPFDFLVFTPRADDADPCEKYRAQLEKLRTR